MMASEINSADESGGVSVEALSAEIARLVGAVEFWKSVRLVVTIATVLAATATFVAQFMEVRRARQVGAKQQQLLAMKDEQLQRSLADRDVRIGEANRAAGEANNSAAMANERAVRLEREAAKQQERAATAERTLLELQERTKPRALTVTQRATFLAALRAAVKGPVLVTCVAGDTEGQALAVQLLDVFKEAGWDESTGVTQAFFSPKPPAGIFVKIRERDTQPPHALVIQQAFGAAGIEAPGLIDAGVSPGSVNVLVGSRY